jgi:Tfp pilus assembly protein PilW
MTRRLRQLRRRLHQDEGTSLIELMVGMVLMVVFLGMFTGAVVMMNSAMNKSQAVNASSSQLNTSFSNLDNSVRYAAFISTPGVGTSGDWYVELRVTNTGTEVCNQLRVDIVSQQLQRRIWTVGVNGAASAAGAWVPISSGITNGAAGVGAATQPFYLVPPALATVVPPPPNAIYQQLTINLISPAGSGSSLTNSTSSFTFTALNSMIPAPTTPICQQQGRP